MTEAEAFLAEHNYGYGRWEAPYWFIGPEQGQDPSENHDIARRWRAFLALQKDGLCDCREFHEHVGIPATLQWYHPITNGKILIQNTWRRLMKILHFYKFESLPSASELLKYQCERLGRSGDETCLVETSGLPAQHGGVERDRKAHREARLRHMVSAMKSNGPKFVVIYRDPGNWGLWKSELKAQGGEAVGDQFFRLGKTRVAFKVMPNAQSDRELMDLARSLREA